MAGPAQSCRDRTLSTPGSSRPAPPPGKETQPPWPRPQVGERSRRGKRPAPLALVVPVRFQVQQVVDDIGCRRRQPKTQEGQKRRRPRPGSAHMRQQDGQEDQRILCPLVQPYGVQPGLPFAGESRKVRTGTSPRSAARRVRQNPDSPPWDRHNGSARAHPAGRCRCSKKPAGNRCWKNCELVVASVHADHRRRTRRQRCPHAQPPARPAAYPPGSQVNLPPGCVLLPQIPEQRLIVGQVGYVDRASDDTLRLERALPWAIHWGNCSSQRGLCRASTITVSSSVSDFTVCRPGPRTAARSRRQTLRPTVPPVPGCAFRYSLAGLRLRRFQGSSSYAFAIIPYPSQISDLSILAARSCVFRPADADAGGRPSGRRRRRCVITMRYPPSSPAPRASSAALQPCVQ